MLKRLNPKVLLYIIWLQSLAATIGSLYFSELADFPPCKLCWYQRIFIYPLVLMAPIGIVKKDKVLPVYVLSLAIPGALIAGYHNLLYYNILPESTGTCEIGVSCTTKYIEYFGFITIPLLSLMGFLVLIVTAVGYMKLSSLRQISLQNQNDNR
jgi:disulfide bond formation protein DsbB